MDFFLPEIANNNVKVFLARAGYHEFTDPNTRAVSYIRRLGEHFYPRFHVYVTVAQNGATKNGATMSMHIDQKHASYSGSHAHAGEYSGQLVESESARLIELAHGIEKQPEASVHQTGRSALPSLTDYKTGLPPKNEEAPPPKVNLKKRFGIG